MYNENNVKCNEECAVEKLNIYASLIDECFEVASRIENKIRFISSDKLPQGKNANTPSRTELESKLKNLLEKLQEIQNNIVY